MQRAPFLFVVLAAPALGGDAGVDLETLQRVIATSRPAINRCYERHIAADGGVPRLRLGFTIDTDGTVPKTDVSCMPDCDALARCIDAALKRLRFPPQDASLTIRYPLNELPTPRSPGG
jgi:hypothetical protein